MTAPDHRPYAGPTDLVTAEDVARWLEERTPRPHPPEYMIRYAVDDLRARLDRERRQACRRGAREAWAHVAELVRLARSHPRWGWAVVSLPLSRSLSRALAFRAAARAR